MLRRIHPAAGGIGFLTVLIFWTSTVASQLAGSVETITAVKQAIPWGFSILAPALATAAISGLALAGDGSCDRSILRRIRRRTPLIAAISILILGPTASDLAALASRGQFDSRFYAVQTLELVADMISLALLSLNIGDGLRLTRLRAVQPAE